MSHYLRSKTGRDEAALACPEPFLILPSQPRFAAAPSCDAPLLRGLFVTSAIMGGGKAVVVALRGESCATWLRTGVKPVRTACNALRARGVVGW